MNFNPFLDGDADYGHVLGCWAAAIHPSPQPATGTGCGTGSILFCATPKVHPRLTAFSMYCGLRDHLRGACKTNNEIGIYSSVDLLLTTALHP